jgi:hypothetical protein
MLPFSFISDIRRAWHTRLSSHHLHKADGHNECDGLLFSREAAPTYLDVPSMVTVMVPAGRVRASFWTDRSVTHSTRPPYHRQCVPGQAREWNEGALRPLTGRRAGSMPRPINVIPGAGAYVTLRTSRSSTVSVSAVCTGANERRRWGIGWGVAHMLQHALEGRDTHVRDGPHRRVLEDPVHQPLVPASHQLSWQ